MYSFLTNQTDFSYSLVRSQASYFIAKYNSKIVSNMQLSRVCVAIN